MFCILDKLNRQFRLKLNSDMDLFTIGDVLEENDIPFFYISFNDEDIINVAKEDNEVVEIYEINGGYIGFQEGIIWN